MLVSWQSFLLLMLASTLVVVMAICVLVRPAMHVSMFTALVLPLFVMSLAVLPLPMLLGLVAWRGKAFAALTAPRHQAAERPTV